MPDWALVFEQLQNPIQVKKDTLGEQYRTEVCKLVVLCNTLLKFKIEIILLDIFIRGLVTQT